MEIEIYGMGYVGLTLAIFMANKGIKVYGYEKDKIKVSELKKGITEIKEDHILKLLSSLQKTGMLEIRNVEDEISDSLISIITLGTPINKMTKKINEKPIFDLCRDISKKKSKTIVLRSTVYVGFTNLLREKFPNLKFVFAPERTIEGEAIKELQNLPQIIASEDEDSRKMVNELFKKCNVETIETNDLKQGELAKLACNTYRDYQFAYFNALACICDELDISVKETIEIASKGYTRFPKGIPGPVSGPCLTKDTYILSSNLDDKNEGIKLIKNSRSMNENVIGDVIKKIKKMNAKSILIIGTSFKSKPETSDSRESHTIEIINKLKKEGIEVEIYDPYADVIYQSFSENYTQSLNIDNKDLIYIGACPNWVKELVKNNKSALENKHIYWAYDADVIENIGKNVTYGNPISK